MLFRWSFGSHHQALNDAEVVVDNLGQGSQTVGCAGGIAVKGIRNNSVRITTSFINDFGGEKFIVLIVDFQVYKNYPV